MLNYVTSCDGCNAGKGARTLDDHSVLAKQRAEVKRLAERRDQVQMMLQWHRGLAFEREYERNALAERWAELADPYSLTEKGLATASKYLRSFSLGDLLSAMEIAVQNYFIRDKDGELDQASIDVAWSKIPGIARISKLPPELKDLYYIRGIIRKRLNYVNEAEAMELLTDAHDVGIDTDWLKRHAKQVRNWTEWRADITKLIEEESKRARS